MGSDKIIATTGDTRVSVRLRVTVPKLDVGRSDGRPITFDLADRVIVCIEQSRGSEGRQGLERVVTASTEIEVAGGHFSLLQSHAAQLEPTQSEWTDEDWALLLPPVAIKPVLRDVHQRLARSVDTVVNLIRWRFNVPGSPPDEGLFQFSLDGSRWVEAWVDVATFPFSPPTSGTAETSLHELQETLTAGVRAPLAWQLFYEALRLQASSPRAAFLLAFSAAEVGVKEFGGRRSASEKWLLDTIQSPPLGEMLANYLPSFVSVRARSPKQVIPDWIRHRINDAVKKRNKVIHSPKGFEPEFSPAPRDVRELLAAVGDLLYLLDWFGGKPWAFSFLSDASRGYYPDGDISGPALRPAP